MENNCEMINDQERTLKLTRIEMYDIRIALTNIICGYKKELADEGISKDRREVALRSLAKWKALKEEVVKQLNEQDAEEEA